MLNQSRFVWDNENKINRNKVNKNRIKNKLKILINYFVFNEKTYSFVKIKNKK